MTKHLNHFMKSSEQQKQDSKPVVEPVMDDTTPKNPCKNVRPVTRKLLQIRIRNSRYIDGYNKGSAVGYKKGYADGHKAGVESASNQ
jgi:flagellar biosynthesis/type III secretory pathway protein FliH